MRRRLQRMTLVLVGVLAVVLGAAALAWACVPAAGFTLSPNRGPAGATVTATASGFPNDVRDVEIRWADDNRVLSTVATQPQGEQGRGFTTSVTIPADAAPGVHFVIAKPTCEGHECVHGAGRAAYEVPSSPSSAPGGSSARARAIARCKRRYRGRTRSARRKQRACIARAKKRYPAHIAKVRP